MSEETMKRTIDWLVGQHNKDEKADDNQELSIYFFGGEPLLNYPVVKYGIEYCKEIYDNTGVTFGLYILTNGTVLTDEIYEFLKRSSSLEGIVLNLQVSMDGCRESHNKTRIFSSGSGSFDLVAKNIKRFREIFPSLIVRQTVTTGNVESLTKDFTALMESGGVTASLTPIVEGDWSKDTIDRYCKELEKCIDFYMNFPGHERMYFNYVHGTLMRMENKIFNSYNGCRAGRKMVGITVYGDIYPCHRFSSYKNVFDYKIGNIYSGGVDYGGENWKKLNDMFSVVDTDCTNCKVFTCNRCYATNLLINDLSWKRPQNGFCEMNREVTKMLIRKINKLILDSKLEVSKGELVVMEEEKKIAINAGDGTEICEDYNDLTSRCLVKLVKENRITNERLARIESHLGIK